MFLVSVWHILPCINYKTAVSWTICAQLERFYANSLVPTHSLAMLFQPTGLNRQLWYVRAIEWGEYRAYSKISWFGGLFWIEALRIARRIDSVAKQHKQYIAFRTLLCNKSLILIFYFKTKLLAMQNKLILQSTGLECNVSFYMNDVELNEGRKQIFNRPHSKI